jgi:sodium/proline symporter
MEYLVIAGYFAVLLGIGAAASRRVHGLADYYVGGKSLGYWVVAFSARASGESAWLYLGLTGLGALVGASALWVVVGEVVGVSIAWLWMARPFKSATDRFDSITIPDYLASRFGGHHDPRSARMLRLTAATLLTVFVTIYVSAQIDATGKAFNGFLGWNYHLGALVGFGVVVAYTLSGGFVAVAWSDLFQGILMLVGLCALPLAAWLLLARGDATDLAFASLGAGFVSLWGPGGASLESALVIVSYLAIGLGFLGSPQVFVRFIAIRDEHEIRTGRWVAIAFTILTDGCAVLSGMLGRALLVGADGDFGAVLGVAGERVLPELVALLFPSLIVGLYIAAVLAAIMSTIDSLLLVASSAVTRDVYQQIWHPDLRDELLTGLSRRVTLALAAVALAIALAVSVVSPDRTVFWYAIFGWSGIAATFCPMIVLAQLWPRYNARGALASMATGAACVPLFKFAVPLIPGWGPLISRAEELAPSFLLALAAGIVATLTTPAPAPVRGEGAALGGSLNGTG